MNDGVGRLIAAWLLYVAILQGTCSIKGAVEAQTSRQISATTTLGSALDRLNTTTLRQEATINRLVNAVNRCEDRR